MSQEPQLPLAISLVGGKYLLFDIDTVSWLRQNHQICGVMGGTLPQSPSQNVFLGLPMQIMPEEAQLLLEKGVAYIIDDARAHDQALRSFDSTRHAEYTARIRRKANTTSRLRAGQKDEQRRQALGKQKSNPKKAAKSVEDDAASTLVPTEPTNDNGDSTAEEPSLFDTPTPSTSRAPQSWSQLSSITPTTSYLFTSSSSTPLSPPPTQIPTLPSSYPLYRHLHYNSYFMTPGLRFGCQYCVYPGDPLRFHSHFLALSYDWDEEIDLMDLVGGGRLGTGVKKGFLIGGVESGDGESVLGDVGADVDGGGGGGRRRRSGTDEGDEVRVRTFSIEWAAM